MTELKSLLKNVYNFCFKFLKNHILRVTRLREIEFASKQETATHLVTRSSYYINCFLLSLPLLNLITVNDVLSRPTMIMTFIKFLGL